MEPTRPPSGLWPYDDAPPAPGWWKASDGQWYPPSPAPSLPPQAPPGPSYGPYGWPPPQGSTSYPPSGQPQWATPLWQAPQPTGNGFSIAGIVLGAIAFLLVPPLFGVLGLIFGGVGLHRKEKLAPVAMIVASLGLVLGLILGALLVAALRHRGG